MEFWRKISIVIISGIFAIIGGGLAWALSEDWGVVFTFLGLLGFFLLAFLVNPEQIVNEVLKELETSDH
ncbi:MAG: hypothetical protein JSV47_01540 [Deltaproteobacteria bacterium]|nr:MAG: hypothetical protein JSV47_01540 [Deltaproteobacteria bacterium]